MKRPCISLMTDFGLEDSYVGQMKGVIASINPDAVVIDLTHAIPPQDVRRAALTLADSIDAFPEGTIHVALVDPGVGTARRAIAAEIGSFRFVCPDNGLLTLVLQTAELKRYVVLDQPNLWRSCVSSTFHGRDIFAPVAAAWSRDCDLTDLGLPSPLPLVELMLTSPERHFDAATGMNIVQGAIVTVDHFGNAITNILRQDLPVKGDQLEVSVSGIRVHTIASCYGQATNGEVLALFGSSGRLELAVVNGNAATRFGIGIDDPVAVHWKDAPL